MVCGEKLCSAVAQMSGFSPFAGDEGDVCLSFMYSDEKLGVDDARLLYSSENDGVVSEFYSVGNAGDLFCHRMVYTSGEELVMIIRRENGTALISGDLMPQMLRFALWIGYGTCVAGMGTVAVHSSCIVCNGKAVLFLGESGTGKSTHTRLWRENVAGAELLNDDSPVLRVIDGNIYIYGSPWSGKTPCYKPQRYELAAVVRLFQAPENSIRRLPLAMAYGALHPSCPPDFAYSSQLYDGISWSIGKVLESVPVYLLGCLPDAAAARMVYREVFGE